MWTHVVWTWYCSKILQLMSVGLAWSQLQNFWTISGSHNMGSQLLQNTEINIVLHLKFWRKYGPVWHLFSCKMIFLVILLPYVANTIFCDWYCKKKLQTCLVLFVFVRAEYKVSEIEKKWYSVFTVHKSMDFLWSNDIWEIFEKS